MQSAIMKSIVILAALALSAAGQNGFYDPLYNDAPEVQIEDGVVAPLVGVSRGGRHFYSYLRIPYAEPPVGDLRFLPPTRNKPFGFLRSTETGPACAQYDLVTAGNYVGLEDCLYLNVHVPARHFDVRPLPVMVYFHGGAFMWSSSSGYGADYFMDEDVIIVTVNFRVGILGFLNAGVPEAQGNQGLKDQVMALQWVQQNIENFGGDASQVTIFGDLSGGSSVHYHMYSEYSKGLFAAGISMGGTAMNPWAYQRNPQSAFSQLVSILGIDPTEYDTPTLVASLRNIDALTLINSTVLEFPTWWIFPYALFAPSIETVINGYPRFLTQPTFMELQKPPVNNVPWMVGVGDEMGLSTALPILNNETLLAQINRDWLNVAPQMLFYTENALSSTAVSKLIRNEYFGDKPIDQTTSRQLIDLNSDRLFYHGDRRSILSHFTYTQKNPQPVYLYQLSHRSNNSLVRNLNIDGSYGVAEMDDLQYLFTTPYNYYEYIGTDHQHFEFSRNFVKLWVHFATHRDTQGATWTFQNATSALNWPQADRTAGLRGHALKYLDINQVPNLINEPFRIRADFWDSLPLMEYESEIIP